VPPGTLKPVCDRQGNASVKVHGSCTRQDGLTEPVRRQVRQQSGSGEGSGQRRARSRRRGRAADLVEADQVECNVLDPVEQAVEFAVVAG
jgi:hypothetical protein